MQRENFSESKKYDLFLGHCSSLVDLEQYPDLAI
jgi:hypothetical protein